MGVIATKMVSPFSATVEDRARGDQSFGSGLRFHRNRKSRPHRQPRQIGVLDGQSYPGLRKNRKISAASAPKSNAGKAYRVDRNRADSAEDKKRAGKFKTGANSTERKRADTFRKAKSFLEVPTQVSHEHAYDANSEVETTHTTVNLTSSASTFELHSTRSSHDLFPQSSTLNLNMAEDGDDFWSNERHKGSNGEQSESIG